MDDIQRFLNRENEDFKGWKKKTAVFLTSQSMSMFGSMLVQYAIIWHITLTTKSGAILTLSTLSAFLPQLLISPFAGVWADRYSRKRLIIYADMLTATSTLILAMFFLFGYRELWLIIVVAAIRSVGVGIQSPAVNAFLPQIVPTERLIKVNSVNGTIQPIIMIAAPVMSGAMLSFSRLESIFFVDVITAILAIGLLLTLKVGAYQRASDQHDKGYLDDLKAGLAYVGQNHAIKTLFLFFAFVGFLITPAAFLSPLLVTRSFGNEVWRLTANEVAFFIGSILGGLIMTAWGGFKNHFRTIGLSCILWAILFAGLGLSKIFALYLIVMFLAGIPMPFLNVPTITLLQEMVRPDMQGRVFSLQQMIMSTVLPAGMLVFGPLADIFSIETLLIITSALMVIPGLWIFVNRRPLITPSTQAPSDYELQPGD